MVAGELVKFVGVLDLVGVLKIELRARVSKSAMSVLEIGLGKIISANEILLGPDILDTMGHGMDQ